MNLVTISNEERDAKLDQLEKVLKEHGIYIAFHSDNCQASIFYDGAFLVDTFQGQFTCELGDKDSDKQ